MTGPEIIEAFFIHYDRVTSFSAPGYEESEALLFLNNAQDQFVKDRVFGQNFQPPAFEDNQKRVVDILPLVFKTSYSGPGVQNDTLYGDNAYKITPNNWDSNNALYVIAVESRVTRTNPVATTEYFRCKAIKSENAGRFVINAANRTHFINPRFFQTEGVIHVMTDYYTTTLDAIRFSIVRKPYPITTIMNDFNGAYNASYMNLNSFVHQEIVDIAVQNALQAIQDPRWQSKAQQTQIDTK